MTLSQGFFDELFFAGAWVVGFSMVSLFPAHRLRSGSRLSLGSIPLVLKLDPISMSAWWSFFFPFRSRLILCFPVGVSGFSSVERSS